MSELDLLEKYLKENGYKYRRIDCEERRDVHGFVITTERHQLRVLTSNGYEWSAICHPGSYGYSEGLIETMAMFDDRNDVTGYQTAEDIIKRLERGLDK